MEISAEVKRAGDVSVHFLVSQQERRLNLKICSNQIVDVLVFPGQCSALLQACAFGVVFPLARLVISFKASRVM